MPPDRLAPPVQDLAEIPLADQQQMIEIIGAKALYLALMDQEQIPIPSGFVIAASVGQEMANQPGSYYESLPVGVWENVVKQLGLLESKTGKILGYPDRPLMVAARSGGPFSMPGLMETILNIGSSRRLAENSLGTAQEWLMWDLYRTFCLSWVQAITGMSMERLDGLFWEAHDDQVDSPIRLAQAQALFTEQWFTREYGLKIPQNPMVQLRTAIQSVFMSWDSPEAMAFRRDNYHQLDYGHTGVTVLEMVFGNQDQSDQISGSGVVIKKPGQDLEITFALNAQGNKVVGDGADLKELTHHIPDKNLIQLMQVLDILSEYFGGKIDAEFVIELGELIMTQSRMLNLPLQEKIREASRLLELRLKQHTDQPIDQLQLRRFLWQTLTQAELLSATGSMFEPQDLAEAKTILKGWGIPGAAIGRLVILDSSDKSAHDMKQAIKLLKAGQSVVICSEYIEPNQLRALLEKFPQENQDNPRISFLTIYGSPSSHTSLVAAKRGVVGIILGSTATAEIQTGGLHIKSLDLTLTAGDLISVDGSRGLVYQGELPIHQVTPTSEQQVYSNYRRAVLGNSMWLDAIMSGGFDDKYELARRRFEAGQAELAEWCSDKANSQEMLNRLNAAVELEQHNFIDYQVIPRRNLVQIINQIKQGLQQGYDVTLRCAFCYSKDSNSQLGKNPWVIFRPGQDQFVDDFFVGKRESFELGTGLGLSQTIMANPGGDYQRETRISKYGMWPDWEDIADEEDLVFEEVLIGYNPSGKLDEEQKINHFAATCQVVNKGGQAMAQLLVHPYTAELRSFEGNNLGSDYDQNNLIVIEVGINQLYEGGIGGIKLGLKANHLDISESERTDRVQALVAKLKKFQPQTKVHAIINSTVDCDQTVIGRYHRLVYHQVCQLLGIASFNQTDDKTLRSAIFELVEDGLVPREVLTEIVKPESLSLIDQISQSVLAEEWGKLVVMMAIVENDLEGEAVLELQGRIGGDWWVYGIKGLEEQG